MVKVLIVDDSKTLGQFLEYILSEDPEIEIIGKCENGRQAVEFVQRTKPDLITMDIDMPIMNGLEATRQIMSTNPVPIIIVTASRNARSQHIPMEALAAGALTVLEKPLGFAYPNAEQRIKKIISLVKVYAQVKVIRRNYRFQEAKLEKINENFKASSQLPSIVNYNRKKVVGMGISTGGPEVLKQIIPKLSERFPLPILIVQHITAGFLEGMVSWLNNLSAIEVKIGENNETLKPGIVYFAPDKSQMGVFANRIVLTKCSEKAIICPSVGNLFESLATNMAKETIAMLLTGMGSDGANELKKLKDAGALTIAQDKKSALIHGMPGEAIKRGAATFVLNIEQILEVLKKIESEL